MSATKEGGLKAAKTNKLRYGKDFYPKIGAKGGKNSSGGGFATMDREEVREAGRKGGTKSRREWTVAERKKHSIALKKAKSKREI
jgi:general stress protein YciG